MSSHTRATGSLRWVGVSHRTLMAWRLLSAIMLLVMGGIHLYLVFDGVGGSLGMLFVLNAVGALVLAIAIIVLRGRLLSLATGLSLLFVVGTLLALVLALYTLGTAFIGHHFWTQTGMEQYINMINFYKNISLVGGFFLLYVTGAGKYAIDARLVLPGALRNATER